MAMVIRLVARLLFLLAFIWAGWSMTAFLGAASSFEEAFPGARAVRVSPWSNVIGIAQFLAVTAGLPSS